MKMRIIIKKRIQKTPVYNIAYIYDTKVRKLTQSNICILKNIQKAMAQRTNLSTFYYKMKI